MSKRKSKKNKRPNIPAQTLEKVMQEASGESAPVAEEPEATSSADDMVDDEAALLAAERRAAQREMRRRKREMNKQSDKAKAQGSVDTDYVEERLANPTKVVTEEQLHEEYGFVLRDLRNMGILAAILVVFLSILAQVL